MVLRRGAGCRIAAGRRLLAHGIGCGYCCAAACSGNWVRAVQAGDGRKIARGAAELFGDESTEPGRCLCGYSIAGWHQWASSASRQVDSTNAFGIRGRRTRFKENEATRAGLLRGLAESAD